MTKCPFFMAAAVPPSADLLEASSIQHDSMADFWFHHSESCRSHLGVMPEITKRLQSMMRMTP